MAIKAATRRTEHFSGTPTCKYWLAGRCNRNPCRFLHSVTLSPSPSTAYHNANTTYKYTRKPHSSAEKTTKHDSKAVSVKKTGGVEDEKTLAKAPQKPSQSICKYWVNGNCVHGDQCQNLHSWFYGDGFSTLTKLHEHKKVLGSNSTL